MNDWLPKKIDTIADIGPGPGVCVFVYANSVNKLYLVDADNKCISYLRFLISHIDKKYPNRGYKDRIVLVRNKTRNICLPENSCDVIIVANVHMWVITWPVNVKSDEQFLAGKKEFFDSIVRATKINGRILVMDGHKENDYVKYGMEDVKKHMNQLYVSRGLLKLAGSNPAWRSDKGFLLCYEKIGKKTKDVVTK